MKPLKEVDNVWCRLFIIFYVINFVKNEFLEIFQKTKIITDLKEDNSYIKFRKYKI